MKTTIIKTLLISAFLFLGFALVSEEEIVVYMIGDSTMANKPLNDNPERGWGQVLPQFFDSTVRIDNHAKNGRSTKSFRAETLWQPIYENLKEGNYVIIQFGHNDEKKEKPERYSSPEDYKKNLIRYVTETRGQKAIPILCTPIVRRRFDEHNNFYDEHGVYPEVVREVAKEYNVPLLDLHKRSEELVKSLGPEESKKIYLWIEPGVYQSLPEGKQDNTHFSEYGAIEMAKLAIEELKKLDLPLILHIKSEPEQETIDDKDNER